MVWRPAEGAATSSAIGRFARQAEEAAGRPLASYDDLHSWSIGDLPRFWREVWRFFEVGDGRPPEPVLDGAEMPGARWFPHARLNFAEHALRLGGARPAIVARSQARGRIELSRDELRDQVARARCGLERLGVRRGDRVAAYLPNCPESHVAHLAVASLGAIWSSCAPEFGTRSVVDRFGQIEPKVLIAATGYVYGHKLIDRRADLRVLRDGLPTLEACVVVPYVDELPLPADVIAWDELTAEAAPLGFEHVPFDHPLTILYSSGTTGLPKPFVHGHGGVLLEHLKTMGLHFDLSPADRFFWFTTTGWMMWNIVAASHLVGATAVLFDGDPASPDLLNLWRLAAEEDVSYFGVSAGFILSCRRAALRPRELGLPSLRAVGSTGSPLPIEGYEWFYDAVASDIPLVSGSGGTDVVSAFVTGAPIVPVYAGEISCRALGCDVAAFDHCGREVVGETGEMVVRRPMPSMPLGFWGDRDGQRMRTTYFDTYPGVWRHGDWVTFTERGTCIVGGRSDATLNRGGVRLGTAEIYSVVENLAAVRDSLVVSIEGDAESPDQLVLFVVMDADRSLDDDVRSAISGALRRELSPRHVPDRIIAAPSIPRTLSGKKLEVPVKQILTGAAPEAVINPGALANPESIATFRDLARRLRDDATSATRSISPP